MMSVLRLGVRRTEAVMPGLVPGIHGLRADWKGVVGRDMGERSDAVLCTAMPGHDDAERVTS
ncbi:hypothetical protein SAMN05216525_10390 [Bradyrhizobium sp. Gha]|nr:hypothetical protein SAMN05216525_10390 [Bradyrhizobium sp. Gha]